MVIIFLYIYKFMFFVFFLLVLGIILDLVVGGLELKYVVLLFGYVVYLNDIIVFC